ncbi:MAG: hypothetical protein KME11_02645 [Timaviella obliquedivisa GSE-PSE-MK23-08B]|jgi:exonuclease VII large subunit|nr:hypothetical protein [Timaviella obliquedivisa GSE-PSE-MK23-08B]
MEELQTEIKAIQVALRSIRANEPRSSVPAPAPGSAHAPTLASSRPARMQQIKPLAERTHRATGQELAMETQRLSHLTSTYVKKLEQPKPPVVHSLDEAFQRLDAQAEEVNQLSAAQEAAILKLKAIAEQVGQDWQSSDSKNLASSGKAVRLPPICEYLETAVPHIEKDQQGKFVVTSRSVDLFKAEREAELNAEELRHRAMRTRQNSSLFRRVWNWLVERPQPKTSQSKTLQSKMQKRSVQRSKGSPFRVRNTVILLVGAIVARVLLDTLLTIFPGLWLPAIAIMVTPSAIAIYRRPLTSESSLIWGYRLVIVLLGLLIGGRI